MKKLFCLILVLVCIGSAALAATVPSRTRADLTKTIKITTLDGEIVDTMYILLVEETEENLLKYERKINLANAELEKLAEVVERTNSIEEYYGEVLYYGEEMNEEAEPVVLADKSIDEFVAIVAGGVETIGDADVLVTFNFPTPYEKDEPVIALIGILDPVTEEVVWTALDGIGVEDGGIMIQFSAKLLMSIQEGDAIFALASDTEAE